MIYDILYIITYIFGMFYIHNFMNGFFGRADTPAFLTVISYLCYPIIVCTLYFIVDIPIVNLMGNLASIFIISLNYKAAWLKRIMCCVFIYMFMFAAEAVTALATGYTGNSAFDRGAYSKPMGLIIVALVLYAFSLIFVRASKKVKKESIRIEEWIAVIFIPAASIFIVVVIAVSENLIAVQGILSIIMIFAIDIMVFHLYEGLSEQYASKMESVFLEQEKKYYYNQCRFMEESSADARRFRHDINNHLISISEIIRHGDADRAEKYIADLIGENIGATGLYSETGNISIDSVINYKLNEAAKANICVNADISVPENLFLDPADFTAIVGNLLDNAINATSKLKEEGRRISLNVYYDKGRLFVIIENTYDGNIQVEDGKLKTTNSDKDNHGLGLQNIERRLEKYDGAIDYSYDDEVFQAAVMMYINAASIPLH